MVILKVSANASQGHEEMLLETVVQQDGYLYSYVSNESTLPSDVYFDDMTMATSATPETFFVITDYQGSARVVADEANNLVAHYDYSPWGATMRAGGTEPDILRYRYTSQEYYAETGLYNYRARLYDTKTGRFLSVDPKAHLFPGWSPYAGMLNNPISNIDPDGQEPLSMSAVAMALMFVNIGQKMLTDQYDNGYEFFLDGIAAVYAPHIGKLAANAVGSSMQNTSPSLLRLTK
ncbi:MAG: RHS repeat-associated core domain-containing protein [Cyclobacteriaceae bacterium]